MINNFTYYTPTKIIFGKDSENEVAQQLIQQNVKKVLVHYGGTSAKKSGLLDRIFDNLKNNNIEYIELGGVVPNPRLSLVREGIALCKDNNVDFILAVGGGSVIDSAKAIGWGASNDVDVWDLFEGKAQAPNCLGIGVVLTIAAAGSEMSSGSVITNDDGNLKRSYGTDTARPRFSILDPQLTMSLPSYQTACGVVDIIMHTMERYFTQGTHMELTDDISVNIIKTTMKYGKIAFDDANNYDARAELMWAGSLSHNGLTTCGVLQGDWATHNIEHELGGLYDVAHGAGLAAVWGSWARYVYQNCLARFVKYGIDVFNIDSTLNDDEIALLAISKTEEYFKSIDMPTKITDMNIDIKQGDLEHMAKSCVDAYGTIGNAKVLGYEDILTIYKNAL